MLSYRYSALEINRLCFCSKHQQLFQSPVDFEKVMKNNISILCLVLTLSVLACIKAQSESFTTNFDGIVEVNVVDDSEKATENGSDKELNFSNVEEDGIQYRPRPPAGGGGNRRNNTSNSLVAVGFVNMLTFVSLIHNLT